MINIYHPLYQEDLQMIIPYIDSMVKKNRTPRILVIGATGLIGSCLVDALIYYNQHIKECISIYTMSRSKTDMLKRFGYYKSDKLMCIEHDIHEKLMNNIEWDYIFHLASNADPQAYERYPYETITANVLGTSNVIEYAKKRNTKIVFTSTMEVYGEIDKEDLDEMDYGALNFNILRAGYPESKRTSEMMYRSAVKEYQIHVVIARVGYAYGPTMKENDSKVVAEFIRSVQNKKNIELKSSGSQQRTYCYVSDVVSGLLTLMTKGKIGESYNLSNEDSKVTIRELAETFGKIYETEVKQFNSKEKDPSLFNTVQNTNKIKKLYWEARVSLVEGIRRTLLIITKN